MSINCHCNKSILKQFRQNMFIILYVKKWWHLFYDLFPLISLDFFLKIVKHVTYTIKSKSWTSPINKKRNKSKSNFLLLETYIIYAICTCSFKALSCRPGFCIDWQNNYFYWFYCYFYMLYCQTPAYR